MPTLFTGTPVDTTGAGDACVAGFIAGYLRGYSLADCAALGAAQAAMIIGQVGATAGVRPLQEVLDYAASKGYNLPR